MDLSSLACYGWSVLTSDGKSLGTFINLMVNRNTAEATLIIFPGLKSEWALKKAGRAASTVSGLGTRILRTLAPELYDVTDVVSEIQYEVVGEVSERAERKATEISSTYYCIPAVNVKESGEDSMTLDLDSKECQSWYRNMQPSPQNEVVFFDDKYYRGPYRAFPISLGLQPIRGMLVSDPAGLSARITDVKFNPSTGTADRIEVEWKGEKNSLDMELITIEYNNIKSRAEFQQRAAAAAPSTEIQRVYLDSTRTEMKKRIIMGMDRPKTATELAKELGLAKASPITSQLNALQKDGAVECLTPERSINRQFYLTEAGLRTRRVLMGEERFESLATGS